MTLSKFGQNRTIGSKVMTKKFTSLGTMEFQADPGNRDLRTVEPGNKKSGYLTSLHVLDGSMATWHAGGMGEREGSPRSPVHGGGQLGWISSPPCLEVRPAQ